MFNSIQLATTSPIYNLFPFFARQIHWNCALRCSLINSKSKRYTKGPSAVIDFHLPPEIWSCLKVDTRNLQKSQDNVPHTNFHCKKSDPDFISGFVTVFSLDFYDTFHFFKVVVETKIRSLGKKFSSDFKT